MPKHIIPGACASDRERGRERGERGEVENR